MKSYSYPIEEHWTREEMIDVISLFNGVESAYEEGILVNDFQKRYKAFKQVVQSISEEKQIGREFERLSGYSIYHVVKEMKRLVSEGQENRKIRLS